MSGCCLGQQVAALVDGELDHTARERAQRHLAHCATCRAEVEAHRRLKALLAGLADAPPLPAALTARLLALPAPNGDPLRPPAPGPVRPVTVRPPSAPRTVRPAGRRTGRRRRAAVGSALAFFGVALALGTPQGPPPAPVDPGTDVFVVQHVQTTGEVPRVLEASITGGGSRPGG
jgi:anti-sigma factor RsiW